MALTAIRADITTLDVDAIVNAANTSLLGGGGSMARFIELRARRCSKHVARSTGAGSAKRR